jgi:hypothetical protein
MQNAFRAVCGHPLFTGHLKATIGQLDALESLGRTPELTLKDLDNGLYEVAVNGSEKNHNTTMRFRKV